MRSAIAVLLAAAILMPLLAQGAPRQEAVLVDVFVSGQDGYHTYRIPSILVTAQGSVLAFCEGRKSQGGDSGDIDLLVKRSTDGGKTFSAQQIVWDDGPNTCGNPCPVIDRHTGTIWLLLTHNRALIANRTSWPARAGEREPSGSPRAPTTAKPGPSPRRLPPPPKSLTGPGMPPAPVRESRPEPAAW